MNKIIKKELMIKKMNKHELKTWTKYFIPIWRKEKKFDVRYNDKNFQKGDILYLNEFDPIINEYLGRCIECKVIYILDDPKFVLEGYIIMSIMILTRYDLRMQKK